MTKWTSILSGVAVATLVLTGCGTTDKDEVKEPTNEEVNEQQNGSSQAEETNDNQNGSSENEETNEEQSNEAHVMEKNLKYTLNKESKEETAFLKTSDNQPFNMYVLPEFELSSEEPGKDLVFLSENDAISMRIELLPEGTDLVETEKYMKTYLSSISESISDPKLQIENGVGYEVVTPDDEVVTSVLIKNEKAPVLLTMFTTKEDDYRSAFLEMAKTILAKK
ncbi:hypothetical protein D1953_05270 [Peribacillus asahii]|uniref:Lipoprotein n=1 Tax=Peribacillus asahii TaxID=228899 RepID=A0A398BCQ6_9BACI|nr:hypothetical protein [Peribacillus asahii]RID87597.1 hypothetical protein D1953_05270 [Peribacillus asahii]